MESYLTATINDLTITAPDFRRMIPTIAHHLHFDHCISSKRWLDNTINEGNGICNAAAYGFRSGQYTARDVNGNTVVVADVEG
jgi:hypothetical protein